MYGSDSKMSASAYRMQRLMNMSNKTSNRTLQLAGTMSLKSRVKSPQSRIRERKGFVTATMVPDVFADKNRKAIDEKNTVDKKTGTLIPIINEYVAPKAYKFRDEFEVELGMKDFLLRTKPPAIDNPKGLSVFAARPKYITDKEKTMAEKQ
jgi:hypothetical protein